MLSSYSLAFGTAISGIIGGPELLCIEGEDLGESPLAGTMSHLIYVAFQLVFVAIAIAILTLSWLKGQRSAPSSSWHCSVRLWFMIPWPTGSGRRLVAADGCLDFVGGIIVHITAVVSALAVAEVIGSRKSFETDPMEPHNIPTTVMGAALLWFGVLA